MCNLAQPVYGATGWLTFVDVFVVFDSFQRAVTRCAEFHILLMPFRLETQEARGRTGERWQAGGLRVPGECGVGSVMGGRARRGSGEALPGAVVCRVAGATTSRRTSPPILGASLGAWQAGILTCQWVGAAPRRLGLHCTASGGAIAGWRIARASGREAEQGVPHVACSPRSWVLRPLDLRARRRERCSSVSQRGGSPTSSRHSSTALGCTAAKLDPPREHP
uniref:Uncharacterized protein n=1 Tax=Mycena chlorophos TaxID=658473 RepID=A0ABQ0LU76_MYCCL|nr:predicted protein [Mycena chlorophos]